jgi:hypothetical protein
MNVTLSLSDEETDELQRRAKQSGTDVKTFLLKVLHDRVDCNEPDVSNVPYDQWKLEFQAWIARNRSRNPNMDDSRGSVYD